ncbi:MULTISPECIES: amidohydrolase family protein [Microbacterium]|uniref:amidohydrolase family protein n=1 Tax=Microbacterium TaxID=33882 RepID=UPI001BB2D07A|nr:amidohydrolase family protein [Microbacterium sp. 4NA327F11]MCK9916922.1 cytosine deaminase [Microbacteriaceae bacterium K1510]
MSSLPRPLRVLRSARLADGSLVDITLDGELVAAVTPADATAEIDEASDLDLRGYLVVTAPAEPHAHLDKARSWDAARPPAGDLVRAIESWRAFAAGQTEDDIAARARAQALENLAAGTTAIRTHVDLFADHDPLRGVRALVRVREELAELIDIQLVALGGEWVPDDVYEGALDLGVDIVGGAPHLAADPHAELHRALDIAERRGAPVDLHTDESLDGPLTIVSYANRVAAWSQPRSAGHCVRLGTLPADELAEVIAAVAAADLRIITLPITNLYLQGWEHPVSTPRGLTAARALLDAGVVLGAGADNVRDPFNPVGRGDALETASLLVTAGHLSLDEALTAITSGARAAMWLPEAGPVVGARAELLAVRADSLGEAIASGSPDRLVIHAGRLVARTTIHRDIASAGVAAASPSLTR